MSHDCDRQASRTLLAWPEAGAACCRLTGRQATGAGGTPARTPACPYFLVWPQGPALLASRGLPHLADCGHAQRGRAVAGGRAPGGSTAAASFPCPGRYRPCPQAAAGTQQAPLPGRRQRGHLCLGPALSLPELQLAPQVAHAARGPGQLLGQLVVGLRHVPQLFPQQSVHLRQVGAPGQAEPQRGGVGRRLCLERLSPSPGPPGPAHSSSGVQPPACP